MLWIKAFHIILVITWFAGLFYLPRLFVYHAAASDAISIARFKLMERRLFYGIMMPSALGTLALGVWLWLGYGFRGGWLHAKLALVLLLVLFHIACGKWLADFAADRNQHSEKFFRLVNEIPVIPLLGCVILVVVKPF